MKRLTVLTGMAAAALVFSVLIGGCEDPNSGGGGGGGGGDTTGTGGSFSGRTLTVTGIPAEHNGKYLMADSSPLSGSSPILYGAASIGTISGEPEFNLAKIENGSATLRMYYLDRFGSPSSLYKPYTGDYSETVALLVFMRSPLGRSDASVDAGFVSADFAGGSQTVLW